MNALGVALGLMALALGITWIAARLTPVPLGAGALITGAN
jgi:hypothetical protein